MNLHPRLKMPQTTDTVPAGPDPDDVQRSVHARAVRRAQYRDAVRRGRQQQKLKARAEILDRRSQPALSRSAANRRALKDQQVSA